MLVSGAFDYVNVLKKAADASYLRNEVLDNNIANVDTPGFKRKDVEFERLLNSAIESAATSPKDSLTKKIHNMDLEQVRMNVYVDNTDLSYRIDDNNVDIATEQVELASNQLVYNGLIDSMTHEFNRIKTVIDK